MAFLVRRPGGRFEIREMQGTRRGPRARTLASFRGWLDERLLGEAAARAALPFDRDEVCEKARALGMVVRPDPQPEARALLARLLRGELPDPQLVALLRQALAAAPAEPLFAERAEVSEWIGVGDAERGEALRGLLRVSDQIVATRQLARERPTRRFPAFRSRRRPKAG